MKARFFLLLIPILMITTSQLLGKYGMVKTGSIINVFVMISIALMVARSFVWFYILKYFDLKSAYPYLSLTFFFVLLASYLAFGEVISINQILGTSIIVFGVIVHSKAEAK